MFAETLKVQAWLNFYEHVNSKLTDTHATSLKNWIKLLANRGARGSDHDGMVATSICIKWDNRVSPFHGSPNRDILTATHSATTPTEASNGGDGRFTTQPVVKQPLLLQK